MLHIGRAQVDITPEQPMVMGGSFKKYLSESVHDPLMATSVVIDDGNDRIAIVSCDLGTLATDLALSIRSRVSDATGTPLDRIHIMVTHNHSGPTTRKVPFADDDRDTQMRWQTARQQIVDGISTSLIKAHDQLTPARMAHGRGRFETGAYNRRFIMSNGRSRMHGGGGLENLAPEGPVDRDVNAIWFENGDGQPLAVMVHYSTHTTNLYGSTSVSADFPGILRQTLQQVLGQNVPVLYLQGACGNIMCNDIVSPRPKGLANAQRIGRSLAGEVLRIMGDTFDRTESLSITAASQTLQIPYRDVPPIPVEQAHEKWNYYKHHWDEFLKLGIEEKATINSTLRLENHKAENSTEDAQIAAFALGDLLFVTNPAELFVEFQLDIKQRFKNHNVIICELTNGWIGYVPTRLACALGGYETIQTRFNPDAGELIREASCQQLQKVIAST